ncbi:hypothetical protein BRD19_10985 [Halobacteriales archaeon SW_7_65_23]|nr:MAG: hypothetical protein BRD19_10985 [Halobacteriales archaeon SW_7_65_23]
MNVRSLEGDVPIRQLAGVLLVLAVVTLLYSLLVTQTILLWLFAWLSLASVGLLVFVVYLLYRLTVAAERIATKL